MTEDDQNRVRCNPPQVEGSHSAVKGKCRAESETETKRSGEADIQ